MAQNGLLTQPQDKSLLLVASLVNTKIILIAQCQRISSGIAAKHIMNMLREHLQFIALDADITHL